MYVDCRVVSLFDARQVHDTGQRDVQHSSSPHGFMHRWTAMYHARRAIHLSRTVFLLPGRVRAPRGRPSPCRTLIAPARSPAASGHPPPLVCPNITPIVLTSRRLSNITPPVKHHAARPNIAPPVLTSRRIPQAKSRRMHALAAETCPQAGLLSTGRPWTTRGAPPTGVAMAVCWPFPGCCTMTM